METILIFAVFCLVSAGIVASPEKMMFFSLSLVAIGEIVKLIARKFEK